MASEFYHDNGNKRSPYCIEVSADRDGALFVYRTGTNPVTLRMTPENCLELAALIRSRGPVKTELNACSTGLKLTIEVYRSSPDVVHLGYRNGSSGVSIQVPIGEALQMASLLVQSVGRTNAAPVFGL